MFQIDSVKPEFWPILFGAGLLSILAILCWRSSRPVTPAWAYFVAIWAGLAGARIWHALQYGDFSPIGGLSAWGFAIGAFVGALLFLKLKTGGWGGDFWDTATPGIALAGAVTRIGCFWAGCNFGSETSLPWSVQYGPRTPAFHHQVSAGVLDPGALYCRPIHPAQLYESAALLAAVPALLLLPRRLRERLLPHERFLGFTIYYATARFVLEYVRDDAGGVFFGPLTFAQGTSLVIVILALSVLIRNRVRHRRLEAASVVSN